MTEHGRPVARLSAVDGDVDHMAEYDERSALAERDSKLEMSRALAAANKYRHA